MLKYCAIFVKLFFSYRRIRTPFLADTAQVPEVAFDAAGDSGLVTWVESNTDGDNQGVFARVIARAIFTDGFESGDVLAWSSAIP